MSENNKLVTGIFILAAGIVILLGKWGVFSFLGFTLWPLIILVPGILLHLLYFARRGSAVLLVPGGILTVYGILFFILNFSGGSTVAYVWPLFILGIAVGLFEYDLLSSPRPAGVFLIAVILTAITVVIYGITLMSLSVIYLLALVLIIGGIWLIAGRGRSRRGW
ncbi:hypothetical protein [Paenibacillus sp. J22TS3]|uniref:hypothetical protein n=1 Tax=Paenibacillus sp. J22TS3 TaxID=2807192 RepID=UPI001B1F550F|nr:hypothetical protein [Paenibacillus sp. J22TS3]GIP20506.1 hypothetical protein J22TS3_07810 [Paenibacillus sp. J22TS3]